MRFIPPSLHAALDVAIVLYFALAPTLFHMPAGSTEAKVMYTFFAVGLIHVLLTRYPLGVIRIIPMQWHCINDVVLGAALILAPWVMGFAATTYLPFVVVGAVDILGALTTETHRAPAR